MWLQVSPKKTPTPRRFPSAIPPMVKILDAKIPLRFYRHGPAKRIDPGRRFSLFHSRLAFSRTTEEIR
jgi:hypothetical protein